MLPSSPVPSLAVASVCRASRSVKYGSLLVGVRSVVDHVACEIVFPSRDDVEQKLALDVDERGEMIASDRDRSRGMWLILPATWSA